ncbi:SLBB domain-containing protein, partial [Frankia tisae]|uniref:SLBB domain-containing protein n=1 Tax=Frankia tisae TaxID=2950104 RepID=UPI0027E2A518
PAGEPQPPIGVREGLFAADDDEWPDADDDDTDGAALGWADRDDADGRSTPRGTDGGVIVDRPVPSERGWPGVRERLTHRLPASLRGVVTAPAASATLVLALVALAAALLATWFAWQHRPVPVAAPARRPSMVVAAPDGTPDGGSADARTAVGRTAAVGAVGAVASPAASTGAAAEVVVDVAGRVTRPGVVRLPAGSRVVDAIDRVGGVLAGTDTTGIGLARVLVDEDLFTVDQ